MNTIFLGGHMNFAKLVPSILIFLVAGFVVNCASPTPTVKMENPWLDESTVNMRHGWTVFSGPERTLIGVNDQASILRGQAVYAKHCQQCHGATGKGDGPLGKTKGLRPTNLSAVSKTLPNYYMVVQMNDGRKNGMPSWKDILDNQESWDVTNYIKALSKTSRK